MRKWGDLAPQKGRGFLLPFLSTTRSPSSVPFSPNFLGWEGSPKIDKEEKSWYLDSQVAACFSHCWFLKSGWKKAIATGSIQVPTYSNLKLLEDLSTNVAPWPRRQRTCPASRGSGGCRGSQERREKGSTKWGYPALFFGGVKGTPEEQTPFAGSPKKTHLHI